MTRIERDRNWVAEHDAWYNAQKQAPTRAGEKRLRKLEEEAVKSELLRVGVQWQTVL